VWDSARVFTIKRSEGAARPPRNALELQNCDCGGKRSVDPTLPLFGDRRPQPLLREAFSEGQSQISPDDTRVNHLWDDARNHYDVSRDGQRFLVTRPIEDHGTVPLTVVVNGETGQRR
jgi:hypothetical protein